MEDFSCLKEKFEQWRYKAFGRFARIVSIKYCGNILKNIRILAFYNKEACKI
ncbi:MAG: hypothetical protein K6C05_09415 [Anaerovibrio sp.]|uniref:hypothetical protein n=1 Tax=Anaerovibrio sp. TaxID=1872532 RepID=UPI0025DF7FFC|nr:hypothetical protein [Anaerovibrio sp.]MCR5177052.1 hypothetical protein [Anaerovibrio sp.]